MYLGKNFYIILIYLISCGVPFVLTFVLYFKANKTMIEEKRKLIRKAMMCCLFFTLFLLFIYSLLPLDRLVTHFHNNFETIEEAYKFDYSNRNKIVFRKKYKNTYFVVGFYYVDFHFDCYKKGKNGWENVAPTKQAKYYHLLRHGNQEITYYTNKQDKVTGIFVYDRFDDKTKTITDSYNTKFDIANGNAPVENEAFPIKSNVYFGLIDKVIDENYYLIIDGEKIKFPNSKENKKFAN